MSFKVNCRSAAYLNYLRFVRKSIVLRIEDRRKVAMLSWPQTAHFLETI